MRLRATVVIAHFSLKPAEMGAIFSEWNEGMLGSFLIEITAKVLRKKVRIYEVPISYTGREFEEGKKITWRDGFAALYALVKFRFVQ